MFRKTLTFLIMVVSFLASFLLPKIFAYSGNDDGSDQIDTIEGFIASGNMRQQVQVDFEREIHTNVPVEDHGLFHVMDQLPVIPLSNTIARTWDEILQKYIVHNGAVAGQPQTVATTPLVVSLASADDKNNIAVPNILEMQFEPTTGFTNQCYIYSKTADGLASNQIQVLPVDPSKLIGISAAGDHGIPADCLMKVSGDYYAQGDRSGEAITTNPTWNENYTMIIKTPWEITKTARLEKLFTKGTKEELTMRRAKRIHMIKLVNALTSTGNKYRKELPNTSNKQLGVMQGMRNFARGGVNATTFDTWNYDVWDEWEFYYADPEKGRDRKILIECNRAFHKFHSDLAKNSFNRVTMQKDGWVKELGILGVERLNTPQGPETGYAMHVNTIFDKEYPGIDTPYWFAIDLNCARLSYLRSTLMETNIGYADADLLKHQFLTELTGRYNLPNNFGEGRYLPE
jgi:hypothetical protein